MKIKYFIWVLLLVLEESVCFSQEKDYSVAYRAAVSMGDKFYESGDFKRAIAEYKAAQKSPEADNNVINQKIADCKNRMTIVDSHRTKQDGSNQRVRSEQNASNSIDEVANLSNKLMELQNKLKEKDDVINVLKAQLDELQQESAHENYKLDQLKADQLLFYALPIPIFFDKDESEINKEECQKIDIIARLMNDYSDGHFVICAFYGTDEYSSVYSEKRARKRVDVVRNQLVIRGVNEEQIYCETMMSRFNSRTYKIDNMVVVYKMME